MPNKDTTDAYQLTIRALTVHKVPVEKILVTLKKMEKEELFERCAGVRDALLDFHNRKALPLT